MISVPDLEQGVALSDAARAEPTVSLLPRFCM